MHGRGHVWQGGMHSRVAGACVMVGGMCGRGCTWQERRLLQQTVRILLECILVVNLYKGKINI